MHDPKRRRRFALPAHSILQVNQTRSLFVGPLPDYSQSVSAHHFLAKLISANEFRVHVGVFVRWFELYDRDFALDRISGEYGTIELKLHLAGNEVHVAADFGGNSRRQKTVNHQPSLFVRGNVMDAFIARHFVEESNVVFAEGSLPGFLIAYFHRGFPGHGLQSRTPVSNQGFPFQICGGVKTCFQSHLVFGS
jgi:hypothetical protein